MAKILIVDDEKEIRTFLHRVIDRMGHESFEAPNGKAALETYHKEKIDLALVDINMPQMDGIEYLEKVIEEDPAAIVIIMTGAPSADTIIKTIEDDGYTYIAKPLSIELIEDLVSRGLAARAAKCK